MTNTKLKRKVKSLKHIKIGRSMTTINSTPLLTILAITVTLFCNEISRVSSNINNYEFVNGGNTTYTWYEAKSYCSDEFDTTLGLWTTRADFKSILELRNTDGNSTKDMWIGLNDVDSFFLDD